MLRHPITVTTGTVQQAFASGCCRKPVMGNDGAKINLVGRDDEVEVLVAAQTQGSSAVPMRWSRLGNASKKRRMLHGNANGCNGRSTSTCARGWSRPRAVAQSIAR